MSDLLGPPQSSPYLHYFLIDDISTTFGTFVSSNFTMQASRAPTRSS